MRTKDRPWRAPCSGRWDDCPEWSFGRDQRAAAGQPAEAALATLEIVERRAQVVGAEVGPQRVDETELGVGELPQQEVREPLLAAGTDEQIDVAAAMAALRREHAGERVPRRRVLDRPARGGLGDR